MRLRVSWRLCVKTLLALTLAVVVFLFVLSGLYPFPSERLDEWPRSPRLIDPSGAPLTTLIASDEQWRIPVPLAEMSPWLIQATLAVEDERFYSHPGVDPWSVFRAAGQNLANGRVVSGASTVTMQVARMVDNKPRTLKAKCVDAVRALDLERHKSKDEILETYLNIAPYGGNLRGVEAASLFYFSKHAHELSLAEAALLAGIPKAPSRYGRRTFVESATKRRSTVLRRMLELGHIDQVSHQRALEEPIVWNPRRFSFEAPHFSFWAFERRPTGGQVTLNLSLQHRIESLAVRHARGLPVGTQISCVVIDVESGSIRAYLGSLDIHESLEGWVDGARASRSPGSALKPFVFAEAFERRRLDRRSLVADRHIRRGGWTPVNYGGGYSGVVSVEEALQRSLNIPAILVLEALGVQSVFSTLNRLGFDFSAESSARAGLSLAVGGVEVTLVDLTNAYAALARGGEWCSYRVFEDERQCRESVFTQATCQELDDVLSNSDDSHWFMSKTGTSSGKRDAWCVGHNRSYAVGVWIGRFDGGGDPSYVGSEVAKPLLEMIFEDAELTRESPSERHGELGPVLNPISFEEKEAEWEITYPWDGLVLRKESAEARVAPRTNVSGPFAWFLNEVLVDVRFPLRVDVGHHSLLCVDSDGGYRRVRFEVR